MFTVLKKSYWKRKKKRRIDIVVLSKDPRRFRAPQVWSASLPATAANPFIRYWWEISYERGVPRQNIIVKAVSGISLWQNKKHHPSRWWCYTGREKQLFLVVTNKSKVTSDTQTGLHSVCQRPLKNTSCKSHWDGQPRFWFVQMLVLLLKKKHHHPTGQPPLKTMIYTFSAPPSTTQRCLFLSDDKLRASQLFRAELPEFSDQIRVVRFRSFNGSWRKNKTALSHLKVLLGRSTTTTTLQIYKPQPVNFCCIKLHTKLQ